MSPSLVALGNPLASPAEQLRVLDSSRGIPPFEQSLRRAGLFPLQARGIATLQINVGKLCNQTCRHCHVDAGPDRREIMTRETMELCLAALQRSPIPNVDITGGAPELNPHFRWLVEELRKLGRHVMDRSNLTVLLLASQTGLDKFLAAHRVEIIASLPYHREAQTDAQRGEGVFQKSLRALQKLNRLGYGREGSGLVLNLVHNPVGAFLPPGQSGIERQFKQELVRRYGVVFNHLYALTNMPISRFLDFLLASGNYESYMEKLANAFNPAAAAGVMCRTMLSVGWDGTLYDCDFNQMLALPVNSGLPSHIRDLAPLRFERRLIETRNHCYGCAAGAGSSCGGATVQEASPGT